MGGRRNGRTRLLLLAAALLAFGLYTLRLDAQSLWYDEGVTAMIAQRDLAGLTRWTAGDIQPPLYYYLLAGWGRLAGWSEWSLRVPSAFAAVLAAPLLGVLARRLTGQPQVAVFAAWLAALHPLLLYYAQEARMYTLLTTLGILAAYLLLRAAGGSQWVEHTAGRGESHTFDAVPHGAGAPAGWVLWAGYVGTAAAAAYTHYFAFFLLAGLNLAVLGMAWPVRRQIVTRLAVANGLVLLLYTPWLRVLFTQLRVDRSYWEGPLKLGEALRSVALSFAGGESVSEKQSLWPLLLLIVVTALALTRAWRAGPVLRPLRWVALCWLLLPVVAVLALAVNVPKFNARYVMIALPGLLLLWAGGLGMPPVRFRPGGQSVRGLAMAMLLALAVYADANWFLNPAFTKDQWREVTSFMRARLQPEEAILLVSGHAWPVWAYYAPDLPVVRLPDLEILDVEAVLDYDSTGPVLQTVFANDSGKRGAWLVNWQDEVVDPNAIVPTQLELSGREKGQPSTFFGLTVSRYSGLRASRFVAEAPIAQSLRANFGGRVLLRGYRVVNNGDLLLFWVRPGGAPAVAAEDLQLTLTASTRAGAPVGGAIDRRLAGYTYPTHRWPADRVVTGRIPAVEWLGAEPQPGFYRLRLGVYDLGSGAPLPLALEDGDAALEIVDVEVIID